MCIYIYIKYYVYIYIYMDVFDNDNVVYPLMASSLGKIIDQWIVGIP